MLELHFNRKIVKSVMKLSNSGLQKRIKLSKFWIFSEMLTSANVFNKFQYLDNQNTKYKCQKQEKVEVENSM